jgi:hypothetical protein
MHDLDRALQEFESAGSYEFAQQGEAESDYESESYEGEGYEGEGYESEGYEREGYEAESDYEGQAYEADYEAAGEAEYDGESQDESSGVYEAEADYESEQEGEYGGALQREDEAVFDEIEEMEQAAALLEVQDEGELDQFLGTLISKVRKKIGALIPPDVQQALAASLKKVARAALPKIGAAFGNFVAPGVGGAIGAGIGANAGKLFGLELEGMSHEDQEFEVARRVVNLGVEAAKNALRVPGPLGAPPSQVAKDAVLQAAYTHAPGLASVAAGPSLMGLVPPMRRHGVAGRRRSGRWFRRGHRIILVGA